MRVFLNCVVLMAVVLALAAGQVRAEMVLANVAVFRPTEGTEAWGYVTEYGNNDRRFDFTHGDDSDDSYWRVDLGAEYTIDHVQIRCRSDQHGIWADRTNGATLQGYAADGTTESLVEKWLRKGS